MPDRPLQLYDVQRNSEQCEPKHSPDPQRRTNAFDLRKAALNRTDAAFEVPDVAVNSWHARKRRTRFEAARAGLKPTRMFPNSLTPELSCGAQWRRVVVDVTTKVGATKRHQLERLVRL